jgi:type IV secretory pathway protease TraF
MEASRQRGRRILQRRAPHRHHRIGGALSWTILVPPAPRLLWNASASAPIGLYRVEPDRCRIAAIGPSHGCRANVRLLAASRHYLPTGVPLVKRVARAKAIPFAPLAR